MTSVLGCIVSALLAAAPAPSHTIAPADKMAPAALAELRPLEVRIRKLFLVRPDLMRYPVPYDTVC